MVFVIPTLEFNKSRTVKTTFLCLKIETGFDVWAFVCVLWVVWGFELIKMWQPVCSKTCKRTICNTCMYIYTNTNTYIFVSMYRCIYIYIMHYCAMPSYILTTCICHSSIHMPRYSHIGKHLSYPNQYWSHDMNWMKQHLKYTHYSHVTWRHGGSDHWKPHCFFHSFFRKTTKKTFTVKAVPRQRWVMREAFAVREIITINSFIQNIFVAFTKTPTYRISLILYFNSNLQFCPAPISPRFWQMW